ncbi:hypothetical protein [Pantoea sp. S18]|uniref:hypothetical protein n=1 Tax=Pantoea sp. S18 TaxID=3019892 RepID=UPI0012AE509A|nr:hypothetical protein [Pantoea sp. S18]MEA5100832.1 hypothetical protein [Pantoea sp. S18]MRT42768.1 hypothetical protein [Enterobacteriaceae bacterium RIT702]
MLLEVHVTLSLITVNAVTTSPAPPVLQHDNQQLIASLLLNTVNVDADYSEHQHHSAVIKKAI